jgi:hypothetical protein
MSITAALTIAKATGLDDWVLDKLGLADSGAAKLAGKILDYATDATGNSSPTKALERLSNNPVALQAFKDKVLANEHELKKLSFADKQNARQMYQVHHNQADVIADRIMKYNPLYIGICLAIQACALYFLQGNASLLSLITSILTMAIKSFFDERKEVNGFFFGSSMGSKQKDQKDKL